MEKGSHYQHFDGKSPLEHLKAARKKGLLASESVHGVEPSGAIIAAADSAREAAVFLTLLTVAFTFLQIPHQLCLLLLFSSMLFIWKTCRSALWGWSRLEKIHRLISQEKWEIEHHREQEKEELLELYQAKGFKDKQLEEVVEVLMADDNRLLQVMLEEELGLSLGSFEHPLRQCIGAGIGVLVGAAACVAGFWLYHLTGTLLSASLILVIATLVAAKQIGNEKIKSLIWALANAAVSLALPYFLLKALQG